MTRRDEVLEDFIDLQMAMEHVDPKYYYKLLVFDYITEKDVEYVIDMLNKKENK